MPTLTIPNTFTANTLAQSAQVNANFNAVAALLNSTLLDSTNIQIGGLATANLADDAVTGAKLNPNVVDDSTLAFSSNQIIVKNAGITATQIASDAVTTAKILDANITNAKLVPSNFQISGSSGAFTTASISLVDITNLSVTITTTGRPVMLMATYIGSPGSGDLSNIRLSTSAASGYCRFDWDRAGSSITAYDFESSQDSTSGIAIPPGCLTYFDTPAAGTYTYKLRVACPLSASVNVRNVKIVAYEMK